MIRMGAYGLGIELKVENGRSRGRRGGDVSRDVGLGWVESLPEKETVCHKKGISTG